MENNKPVQELYDYVNAMQNRYIKEAKSKKDKVFSQGVDAILTATTLIKMKIKSLDKSV